MLKVMITIISLINNLINLFKQFVKPNKKTPTVDVTITIASGDNNKVDVYFNQK